MGMCCAGRTPTGMGFSNKLGKCSLPDNAKKQELEGPVQRRRLPGRSGLGTAATEENSLGYSSAEDHK